MKKFNISNCNQASTPAESSVSIAEDEHDVVDPTLFIRMIGSLRYLCHSRPDISYVTGMKSKITNKLF